MASENAEKFLAQSGLTGKVQIRRRPEFDKDFASNKQREIHDGQEGVVVDSHDGNALFDVFTGKGLCAPYWETELKFETIAEVEARKKAEAEAKKNAKK